MNTNGIDKKKSTKVKPKLKESKQRSKILSLKMVLSFVVFELIFTICTFPFILLYGPFENAKRTYVGAAMGTMSTQYLATWFLSDEKIESIIGKASSESSDETTNISSSQNSRISMMILLNLTKYN